MWFGQQAYVLTQYRDGVQSGLHRLEPLLVIGEAVGEPDVCEEQRLLVFRDGVHHRQ